MSVVVNVTELSKQYRKRKTKETVEAVKGISFSIKKGEVVGLLGPNGAGKTTTIKMMCGLLIPSSGTITMNGVDMRKHRLKALKHISAVLEGNRNLYWRLTVRENLEYFSGNRGFSRKDTANDITKLLERFRLLDKQNELVSSLSRGMQQKLAIAVALLVQSEIIFLDEPTLGLDVEAGYEIREILKEVATKDQKTIIITSHDMPVIQDICQRVIIINQGSIVTDDTVENLLSLFDTKAYSIVASAKLHEKQKQKISNDYIASFETKDNQTIITVTIQNSKQFYRVVTLLESMHIDIERVDRAIVDFEEVFMNIVKGEGQHVSTSI